MDTLHRIADFIEQYTGMTYSTQGYFLKTLVVVTAYILLRSLISILIRQRSKDISRQYIAIKTVNYLLGFLALVAICRVWLGGLSGMAAYFGILSAGLAIALQDPVTNLAGWLFITLRKPFGVGDRIQIDDRAGDVIDIRLFQFTLMEIGNWVDADQSTGRMIHIPNGLVFKRPQATYTEGFNFIWHEIPITVTFESNWKEARKILTEVATNHNAIQSEHAAKQIRRAARKYLIFFQHLTPIVWTKVVDIGVTLTVRYLCDPRKRRSSESAIWEDVLDQFAEREDIDFAYPTTRYYDNLTEGKPGAQPDGGDA